MKKRHQEERSRFFALESHFQNTFHSGIYLSQSDLIAIGAACDIALSMSSRELLLKNLFAEADKAGALQTVSEALVRLIDERVEQLQYLGGEYPGARAPLMRLIQKANGTKALLARETKGDPYA